jgi:superfamily I DNA/RNA helicase
MEEPGLVAEVGARFDHVLVDEYQDTNALQAAILLGMKPDGRGLAVVGDDAQSIYSFRAATVRNILDFPKHCGVETEYQDWCLLESVKLLWFARFGGLPLAFSAAKRIRVTASKGVRRRLSITI